ncbi:MAG: ABC transporter substrate-binding protein, partial [Actinomycetota bacterium]|nr:ABC transporter substrate-binding protein [Actinomycetota bacterium]
GAAAADEWLAGRYDVLHVTDRTIEGAPNTLVEIVPELGMSYVGFRADRPPFSSELVRKAFSHAVDRERLLTDTRTLARAATLGGAIPPAMPGHSHRVSPAYDPDLARSLLAKAGYAEGRGLPELDLLAAAGTPSVGELAEQWSELGARVNVVRVGEHVWSSHLDGHQMWVSGWTADYPDPDGFFRGLFYGTGWPFYRDDEIDGLIAKARSLRDQGERMRLYHEVDRLWVAEHAAILPLFYNRRMLVRRPWVEGLWANPLTQAQLDQVVVRRQ